jgi:hypothetical protein
MNLHDPSRPKISHRPAFTSGWHVIPRLQIWPKSDMEVEISLMLPIADQRFSGKWYTETINSVALQEYVEDFYNDPEKFVLDVFNLDISKLKSLSSLPKGDPGQISSANEVNEAMELLK